MGVSRIAIKSIARFHLLFDLDCNQATEARRSAPSADGEDWSGEGASLTYDLDVVGLRAVDSLNAKADAGSRS